MASHKDKGSRKCTAALFPGSTELENVGEDHTGGSLVCRSSANVSQALVLGRAQFGKAAPGYPVPRAGPDAAPTLDFWSSYLPPSTDVPRVEFPVSSLPLFSPH